MLCFFDFFFFKQKTAYEMRISDWSSDVCSSDLLVQQCFAARRHRTPSDRADNAVRIILEGVQVGRLDDPRRRSGPAGSDQACGQTGAELQSGESRHEIGRASCRERVWQYVWI